MIENHRFWTLGTFKQFSLKKSAFLSVYVNNHIKSVYVNSKRNPGWILSHEFVSELMHYGGVQLWYRKMLKDVT